jgi:hypothetical protein
MVRVDRLTLTIERVSRSRGDSVNKAQPDRAATKSRSADAQRVETRATREEHGSCLRALCIRTSGRLFAAGAVTQAPLLR